MFKIGQRSNLSIRITHQGQKKQRILGPGEKLTLGQDPENDIVYYGDMPKRHAIITSAQWGFNLNLLSGMQGETWINGSRLSYADLIQHRLLPRKGKNFVLKITPDKQGYVQVGDLLIEFSPTRELAERASEKSYTLLASLGKSAKKEFLFKAALLVGFVLEIFIYGFVSNYKLKPPERVDIQRAPQRLAKFVMKRDIKEETDLASGNSGSGTSQTGTGRKESDKQGNALQSKGRGGGSGTGSEFTGQGVLGLISGVGEGASGSSVVDFLVDQGLVKDFDTMLSGGAGGLKKGKGGYGNGKGTGDGFGDGTGDALDELLSFGSSGGSIDDIVGGGGSGVKGTDLTKKSTVVISQPKAMQGNTEAIAQRNAQSTMAVVNSIMGRIQYTYNKYLKGRPDLGGKISLDVTIEASGSVSNVRIVETTMNHPELERDIVNIFRRLKFQSISSGTVTVNIPLVLNRVN